MRALAASLVLAACGAPRLERAPTAEPHVSSDETVPVGTRRWVGTVRGPSVILLYIEVGPEAAHVCLGAVVDGDCRLLERRTVAGESWSYEGDEVLLVLARHGERARVSELVFGGDHYTQSGEPLEAVDAIWRMGQSDARDMAHNEGVTAEEVAHVESCYDAVSEAARAANIETNELDHEQVFCLVDLVPCIEACRPTVAGDCDATYEALAQAVRARGVAECTQVERAPSTSVP